MDLELSEQCRANEPGAFEALYRAQAPRLFGMACRLVGRAEAEDLLQEIFLTAYRKLGSYRGDAAIGTWIFRLGTNVCLDHLRSRANRTARLNDTIEDGEDIDGTNSSGPILDVLARIDLERALELLPAKARAIFVLHDVEGLEHKDIAVQLGIAEGTSKSQLHKARMRLRRNLRPAGKAAVVP
jgi:RNA polymerase sigma-70 factor (ECF subfamily)